MASMEGEGNTTQASLPSKPRFRQNLAGEVIAQREGQHNRQPKNPTLTKTDEALIRFRVGSPTSDSEYAQSASDSMWLMAAYC